MTTAAAVLHEAGGASGHSAAVVPPGHDEWTITITADRSLLWVDTVVERLNAVGVLRRGWDGEAAEPPTRTAAVAALRALFEVMWHDTPAPAVVPMYDGGLQLEWHGCGVDIELTVGPRGERHVWIGEESGLVIDAEFRQAVEDVRKRLGILAGA